jgi:hypothetical protein
MHFRALLTASCALLVTHAVPFSAFAQDVAASKPASIAIVELFTSEGCSSCPPADALLRQINLKQTNAGQLIVGISETECIRIPPSAEGSYTPQMVLNGRDQFVGSDGGALERALLDDTKRIHFDLRIITSTLSADSVDVKFSFSGHTSKPMDVVAVLTDDADSSNVLRGENSGRLLQHVSVARSLTKVATVAGDAEESILLSLPEGFQVTAGPGHHLVLFVQEAHQGMILGAATASL